jgi:hypothetical protein
MKGYKETLAEFEKLMGGKSCYPPAVLSGYAVKRIKKALKDKIKQDKQNDTE